MECEKCLEENNRSIIEKGYGYGYIGMMGHCEKHDRSNNLFNTFLKWTNGKPYERSRRMKQQIQIEQQEFKEKMDTMAYTSSLNYDENTWEILNKSVSESGFKVSNKREELGDKLANREMIQQIGINPFLDDSNYVNDISIRDQFLKPINTTQGEKN